MAWKSTTFRKSDTKVCASAAEAILRALEKNRTAMSDVVSDAKKLADERRLRLESIKDPELKRSAAR